MAQICITIGMQAPIKQICILHVAFIANTHSVRLLLHFQYLCTYIHVCEYEMQLFSS